MVTKLLVRRVGCFQRQHQLTSARPGFLCCCLLLLFCGLVSGQPSSVGGLQFDGTDDYVTFGPAPELGSATFTLETWFKRTGSGVAVTSGSGGVNAVPLVTKGRGEGDGSNVDMNYFLGIRTTDNVLVADFEDSATGLNHPVAGQTIILMNTWYHAAVSYDGNQWAIYLNGVLEDTLVVGKTPRADSIQHAALGSALTSGGTPAGYFAGVLDEVRIWNVARSGPEILASKDLSIASAPGLVGSWLLDEAGGITANDSSGSAVNGTLVNGPVWVNAPAPPPPVTYVTTGSIWKYLDNGSDAGTGWRAPGFDDSSWASGPAELGYGDGGEATIVSYGPDTSKKYITTYFRHSFTVDNPTLVESLTMRLLRDDGAIIYLNGIEATRQNMPSGTVTYTTVASAAVGGTDETTYFEGSISPALLVQGENVLAVEIHQSGATSTDISFDLELTGVLRTMTINLLTPLAGAVDMSRSPTLSASVTHRLGTPMTGVIYGRVAPPPAGPDFTIAVLPDTQNYTASVNGGAPAMFISQADWIVNNVDAWNIVYVAQEGDISNDGDSYSSEWQNATDAMYRLDPARPGFPDGIPYGVAVGNHDLRVPTGDTEPATYYNQYFGIGHYTGRSYYGGHYGANNNNQYQLFSASGLDFIVILMEYNTAPSQATLDWANTLLQTHSSRRGIVVCHSILNVSSPATFTSQGSAIYNALKANPNFFLMLCGHNSGEARREDTSNGYKVYSLLADYQSRTNGGSAFMRLLQFSPNNNLIRVRTHSPYYGGWEEDSDSQFDLLYNMESGAESFAVLGTFENLASGATITHLWEHLQPTTTYEWYVTANDGTETVTSERRRFTTGPNLPPIVSISSPANGANFEMPASIEITADATDGDGTVTKVEFFQNGTLLSEDTASPFAYTWTPMVPGSYALTAVAYDNEGGVTTSSPINVTVNDSANVPPVVSITSPTAGSTFEGPVNVTIVADASDSDGIARVEFYSGATKLGEVTALPYEYTWNNVAAGTYMFSAKAYDTRGAATFSAGVGITVLAPPALVRGPYLQLGAPSSVVVRWRTDRPAESRLQFGYAPAALDQQRSDPTMTTEHAIVLTGLAPATQYYYQVGTEKGWFDLSGNEHFVTAPAIGTAQAMRIWVLGDSGGANEQAALVRNGFLGYADSQPANLMLMLGDNAFLNGTDAEYQAAVFNMYPTLLPNTVVWPTLGEMDTAGQTDPPADLPYFNIFNLPAGGEVGGVASGTEKYYSFNRGNVHFICLDSMSSERTYNEPMLTWLRADLAANTQKWLVAYWHHPPYSKGSHDADTETESMQMCANALLILEGAGVDLVLSGHSRSYERSFLINGCYGDSSTFLPTMKVDGGDGRITGTGAYQKPPGILGTVYVVAGSGSETGGGSLNHPAMLVSANVLGSLVLDVNGDRMDVAFVGTGGAALDQFTILKTPAATEPPAAPTALIATVVSATAIDLQWTDNATDEVGFKIERSTDGISFTETARVGANISSTRMSGLTADTVYYFRVRAYNTFSDPDSDYSNVANASTPALPAPTGLSATAGDKSVTLIWNEVADATGYRVWRSTVSGGGYTKLDTYPSGISYGDSGLVNGTTYYYVVTADFNGQTGSFSAEASATPFETVPPEITLWPEYLGLNADASCHATLPDLIEYIEASDNDTLPELLVFSQNPPPGTSLTSGETPVIVTVSDASGNQASCTNIVAVDDITPPLVTLNGPATMTVELGGEFIDPGAQALDACSGTLQVTRVGSVDVQTEGAYILTYTAQDGSMNTGSATRTVTVVDTPPTLSDITVSEITMTTARITWTTDQAADSTVEYGLTSAYGSTQVDLSLGTSHVIDLIALTPGTTYYYNVKSTDAGGNWASLAGTFTTAYKAIANQNPVLTYGTLGEAGYAATHELDGSVQTMTEAGSSARLQADYTLHADLSPAQVIVLTLRLEATWTALQANDSPVVAIWNGSAWANITADIADGAFTPVDNPQNYVNANGDILVRFTDSLAKRNEPKDTLAIDVLYAEVTAGPPDTQAPTPPVGLAATVQNLNVTLNWSPNTETDLAGYRVYRSIGGAPYELLAGNLVTSTTYTDATPGAGTYYYVVSAVDSSGNESMVSSSVQATTTPGATPAAPTGLTATTVSKNQIRLSWTDNSANETGFEVERSLDSVTFALVSTVAADTATFANGGLRPNTLYYYRVRAVNSAGASDYSNVASARTLLK